MHSRFGKTERRAAADAALDEQATDFAAGFASLPDSLKQTLASALSLILSRTLHGAKPSSSNAAQVEPGGSLLD
jgi:hypothetical protein